MNIVPSILDADHLNLQSQIEQAIKAGIHRFHLDIMDAHFVPNLSFGPGLVKDFKQKYPWLNLEIHLMSDVPQVLVPAFVKAGADLVEMHYEAMPAGQMNYWLQYLAAHHVQAGLAINPETKITVLPPFLPHLQQVLLMTVHPGFGGQRFLPAAEEKIRAVHALLARTKPQLALEVDGGINAQTIVKARKAGANVFVVGSYLFSEGTVNGQIKRLRQAVK